jgi:hypothetical protein
MGHRLPDGIGFAGFIGVHSVDQDGIYAHKTD